MPFPCPKKTKEGDWGRGVLTFLVTYTVALLDMTTHFD